MKIERLWRAAAVCLLAAVAACSSAPIVPTEPPTVTGPAPTHTPLPRPYPLPRLEQPQYGIQAFLWWFVDNKTGQRDADLVKDLGFGWLKQQFSWRDIAGSRGAYDWFRTDSVVALAEERGLELLVRLDKAPFWALADLESVQGATDSPPSDPALFGEFCGAVAGRYAGRIAAYEVWNEPNLTREWGNQPPDPAGYAELLKACYLAIKAADPNALVISAGLAPTGTDDPAVAIPDDVYFQGLYDAGAAPYFDMLGVHAPGYMNPPERSPDDTQADPALAVRWITFRHVEDIRALMVANGDSDKQIAVTELGWTSDTLHPDYAWYAVDEQTRADYLVRAYQYARDNWQPWIGLLSMVYIADPQWTEDNEQYWWAITRPTAAGDPAEVLPAYEALRDMPK